MVRTKKNILIIMCMVLVCTVAGCKKEAEKPKVLPVIKISKAAVEFAFKQASDVYVKLKHGMLSFDYEKTLLDDDRELYKVANINNFKDLETYLHKFFSEQIVQDLMAKINKGEFGHLLKEIKGTLYTDFQCMCSETYHDEIYTHTKIDDYKVMLNVKATKSLSNDLPIFEDVKNDFVYENLDGKKWVFTTFPFF